MTKSGQEEFGHVFHFMYLLILKTCSELQSIPSIIRNDILSLSTSFAKNLLLRPLIKYVVDKLIYDMSVQELEKSIQLKEIEYREAIKAKKVFSEVKKIMEQKRAMEKLLLQHLQRS